MYNKLPLVPTGIDNVYHLAPIPVFMKVYDDHELHDEVFQLGLDVLSPAQKKMGQELPEVFDSERQQHYQVNYERREMWVEPTEYNPIGSRFWTPPNDFLDRPEGCVQEIKRRCENGFIELLDTLQFQHRRIPTITESWIQYYNPTEGRGSPDEETILNFVGGYYLSDGEPLKDHPYSGVFTFHIRGMSYFIRPKKGMLMIWPYDIVHSVKPFYGKTQRCVINFNIQDFK
jgi:hypothetical protein